MPEKKITKKDIDKELAIIDKLPPQDLIAVLEKKGISVSRRQEFKGPLPPQALKYIDKNSAKKLVEHFIEHTNNQDKLNDKFRRRYWYWNSIYNE